MRNHNDKNQVQKRKLLNIWNLNGNVNLNLKKKIRTRISKITFTFYFRRKNLKVPVPKTNHIKHFKPKQNGNLKFENKKNQNLTENSKIKTVLIPDSRIAGPYPFSPKFSSDKDRKVPLKLFFLEFHHKNIFGKKKFFVFFHFLLKYCSYVQKLFFTKFARIVETLRILVLSSHLFQIIKWLMTTRIRNLNYAIKMALETEKVHFYFLKLTRALRQNLY